MLQLNGIKKQYVTSSETVDALKGVDLYFRKNEFVSILGPSGCGKTTMLNIIGGLDKYSDGDLVIRGKSTKDFSDRDWDVYRNHRVGFIFQSYNLIPHQTILGNVELALTIAGVGREERTRRAKTALDRVGLKGQYYKRPNQLSGGQCQRVAIARALVNDPEILLADEPTGALDTVTSKQIMELIKEISGERLVIMVTHNPEIAEEYSTRIIRLLDGRVIEDTNPLSRDDEERECTQILALEDAEQSAHNPTVPETKKKKAKAKKEKAKMSFLTALALSAKNLLSKKGRTIMVGIAGSIGIIGIALVLAFSAGVEGYIASMQDDMLSGNPIEIAETGFNTAAVNDVLELAKAAEKEDKLTDKVYISSLVANLAKMNDSLEKLFAENTITREYVEYVKKMDPETYRAMILDYGINLSANIFTDFSYSSNDEQSHHVSIKRMIDMYTAVLAVYPDYAKYSYYIPFLSPSFAQAPDNEDYLLSQYDLLGDSKVATEENEIMLVLNSDDEISDLLLAALGYYTEDEFFAIIDNATPEYDENGNRVTKKYDQYYKEYFSYDELLGKTFVYYPNDTIFTETQDTQIAAINGKYQYNSEFFGEDIGANGGIELKVVGILTPKENVAYGSLTSGVYYTLALTDRILADNIASFTTDEDGDDTYVYNSEFLSYLMSEDALEDLKTRDNITVLPFPEKISIAPFSLLYNFTFRDYNGNTMPWYNTVSPSNASMSSMASAMGMQNTTTLEDYRNELIRNLGGNNLAESILIFPISFDAKNLVTDYLDEWNNSENPIIVDGTSYVKSERNHVTYTDTLELVISMINTLINVVKYTLVAFTSISLVVSTVMIGIITYVSVVERIKEIGVIRALGGRKKDVSHLFNAETFIIGLLAGLIGILFTYFVSTIINFALAGVINYFGIASLPISDAITLIVLSVGLTCISGLIPARSAARKDPVIALRTE